MSASVLPRYPHQLSSGQRQRIAIARAVICEPDLLIADEAVAALDLSVQAQILELLAGLRDTRGIAIVFISHDLAVIRQLADTVGVMYRGRLMEKAPAGQFFAGPLHPYSRALLAAVPSLDPQRASPESDLLPGLDHGTTGGCAYRHRCPEAMTRCRDIEPPMITVTARDDYRVKCHLHNPQGNGENSGNAPMDRKKS